MIGGYRKPRIANDLQNRYLDQPTVTSWDFGIGASGPTIFVRLRTVDDVKALNEIFLGLAERPGARIDLSAQPGIQLHRISRCELVSIERSLSKRLRRVNDGPAFEWSCTADEWATAAALLDPFLAGSRGHQYLTQEGLDDAIVEVSYGEEDSTIERDKPR